MKKIKIVVDIEYFTSFYEYPNEKDNRKVEKQIQLALKEALPLYISISDVDCTQKGTVKIKSIRRYTSK